MKGLRGIFIPVALLGAFASLGFSQELVWNPFDQGLKDAAAGKKYAFVDVYTDWCGYCKMMESTTLKAKPVLAELEKNFVSIKFNAESQDQVTWKGKKIAMRDLSMSWGVEGFPTLLFISPKGEIIGSFSSYAEADLMINLLKYISSGARERKVSFEEFLKGAS
jgi:thioredoxin-related protein